MSPIEPGPLTLEVPLRQDSTGVIRIGTSRVLLGLVIRAFQEGETPEAIVQSYETLTLADVYAVLGCYLAHADAIEDYLRHRVGISPAPGSASKCASLTIGRWRSRAGRA